MEKNYMITSEEILRDKFNSQNFKIDNIECFLTFYMLILEFAFQEKIITVDRRNKINDFILLSITRTTGGKAILIANTLYCFSLWLRSMTPWEAWKQLEKINNEQSAIDCITQSDKWIKNKLSKLKFILNSARKCLISINNDKLNKVFYSLVHKVDLFEGYNSNEELDLKDEHTSKRIFFSLDYIFLNSEHVPQDCLQELEYFVDSFVFELKIMLKLNAKKFLVYVEKESNELETQSASNLLALNSYYDNKIDALKKEFLSLDNEARMFNQKYDSMSEEEQLKVPDNIIEKYDLIRIRDEYERNLKKVQEEWAKAEQKSEKEESAIRELEGEITIESSHPSLYFIIKEFALYSLVKKGILNYPENRIEKGISLEKMSISEAISEVLENYDNIGLTKSEVKYLESCK